MRVRLRPLLLTLLGAPAVLAATAVVAGGCGSSTADGGAITPDASADAGGVGDTRVQVIEVTEDVRALATYCGDERFCDPDLDAICTTLVTDAGGEASASPLDAADSSADATGDVAPSVTLACRVVPRENRSIAACAPSGTVTESNFCGSDDDCAPGLACVGSSGLGRCLRYCCKEWAAPSLPGDTGSTTHYCTPQPVAARPVERVPVWVKLDNCTLLDDALQCAKGTTCTVVTNDGRTTCVPAGSGRDFSSCASEPCDRGYVCLGTVDRRCRKLCRDDGGASQCAVGAYCQKVPTIPGGYGICAGGDAGS